MTIFAIRRKILVEAMQDAELVAQIDKCLSLKDCENLLVEWCMRKGYSVKEAKT